MDCRALIQVVDGRPTVAASPAFIEIVNALDPQALLLSHLVAMSIRCCRC